MKKDKLLILKDQLEQMLIVETNKDVIKGLEAAYCICNEIQGMEQNDGCERSKRNDRQ